MMVVFGLFPRRLTTNDDDDFGSILELALR